MTADSKFKLFEKDISQYRKRIHLELEKFFDRKIKDASLISKQAVQTLRVLKEYNLRKSKRIRPIVVNIGYFINGGKNKKAILKASLCVEFIHNFFLIHDDIIDQDKLRRGKLSLHAFYWEKLNERHLGESLALVGGDINNTLGYQILFESNFPIQCKMSALNILSEMVEKTCHGEMLELFLKKEKVSEKNILDALKYKTAYYTFVNPLKIGAALAGKGVKTLKEMERLALPLGMAFQIQDDILGIFGSSKKVGKPVVSDIRENQPNLLIFKTLSLAKPKDRQRFKNYLGRQDLDRKDVKEIRKIIKENGAFDYCQRKAERLVRRAKLLINDFKATKETKRFLLDLADYIIRRDY